MMHSTDHKGEQNMLAKTSIYRASLLIFGYLSACFGAQTMVGQSSFGVDGPIDFWPFSPRLLCPYRSMPCV